MILTADNKSTAPDGRGYFRIGHVVLDIPPEDIVTNRVANTDEVTPIRSPYAMYMKTGQTRWDVTVRWTAMVKDTFGGPDYSQWEDLRHILAIFRAAPFVQVENGHLREVFAAILPSDKDGRLAFGLRQLRIETHSDIVNALQCTLTMTLFNYHPYSDDFAYRGAKGNEDKTEAYLSPDFLNYINTWIGTNLDMPRDARLDNPPHSFPVGAPWRDQDPGTLEFRWRLYRDVNYSTTANPPQPNQLPPAPAPPSTATPATGVGVDFDTKVAQVAARLGIDPKWLINVMYFESGLNPAAKNNNSADGHTVAVGLIQFTRPAAALVGSDFNSLLNMTAVQQMDYVEAYFVNSGFSGRMHNQGDVAMAVFAPIAIGKPDEYVLYQSPSLKYTQNKPLDKAGKGYITRYDYTSRLRDAGNAQPPSVSGGTPAIEPVTTTVEKREDLEATMRSLVADEWQLDHFTDDKAFFFKEYGIKLTDSTHSVDPNQFSLFPQGFVLLFVNNLAQIPLANYQYPTYQHVGPATTMVSIGMTSVGLQLPNDKGELPEPAHPGIREVNFMSHQLEEQYFRMKTAWRSQRSVWRMQAVRVYNQVLNMLGVYGLMLNDVVTTTIPETTNLVAVNLTARQYENIFEELKPYKVMGPKDAYTKPVQNYLMGDDIDKGLSDKDKQALAPILRYRDARRSLDLSILDGYLQDPANPVPDNRVPLPFPLSSSDLDTLRMEPYWFDTSIPFAIGNSNNWNFQKAAITRKDVQTYEIVWADAQRHRTTNLFKYTDATNKVLDNALAKLKSTPDGQKALGTLMDELLPLKMATDPAFQEALKIMSTSPTFKNAMAGIVGKPSDGNPNHGAYIDLGLPTITVDGRDWNPGYYFIDYSDRLDNAMRQGLDGAALVTRTTDNTVNNPERPGSTPIDVSTPVIADSDDPRSMVKVPDYKMGAAFPTFKLFLIEEDNNGIFYALDDFYSYSTVTDIEIIRYQDKPDVAVIQLTNFAALLTQKVFDDTAEGRWEAQKMHRFDKIMGLGSSDGGVVSSPTGAGGNTGVIVGENQGQNYMVGRDMRSISGLTGGRQHTPLQIFALQPGTKIEVRMGFTNDPDNLVRVFAGQVSEVEGDEVLTVRAQGFMGELMVPPADKITASGPKNILQTGQLHGPKFGGPRIWGDAGDSATVIEKMLQCTSAKHFGHWQVNAHISKNFMSGFKWEKLTGKLIGGNVGAMIQGSGDRSGENIMVNEVASKSATNSTTGGRGARTLFDEHPYWIIPPHYYVEEDGNVSPWVYIRDVARRYPEYSLLVKDYGFPFGCDATLIFGHPRDFYSSRPDYFDESRLQSEVNNENKDKFQQWWRSKGRTLFEAGYDSAVSQIRSQLLIGSVIPVYGPIVLAGFEVGQRAQKEKFLAAIDQNGLTSFNDALDKLGDGPAAQFITFLAAITPNILISDAAVRNAQEAIRAVRRQWEGYRDYILGGASKHGFAAKYRPVRKYHFANHFMIVHNGITVNEKILNAVDVCGTLYKANENTPDQYTRVLNTADLIVRPDKNVDEQGLGPAYAASFLKEEVSKMYRGELVLRGMPEIEPNDVIIIADPSTAIVGPVEVDSVIHSFNQEQGYITIVKPRLYISINEASSKEWVKRVAATFWPMAWATLPAAKDELSKTDTGAKIGLLLNAGSSLITTQAVNAVLTRFGLPTALTAARAVGAGIGIGTGKVLIVVALLAAAGFCVFSARNAKINPILISPLSRYGRPWIAGIEGYEISDWFRLVRNQFDNFYALDIEPVMESFREAMAVYNGVS